MKIFVYASISILLISSGCKVAEKEFRKGDYDEAINICVKKLVDNPDKAEYITILEEAFARANGEDLATIEALNKEGQPDRWEEIFNLYQSINIRQNKIKPLLPIYLGTEERDAEFNFVNAVDGMNTAKKNAVAYWYALATDNLKSKDVYKARDAYYALQKIEMYYNNYKDVSALMVQAKNLGTNDVVFTIKNSTYDNFGYDVNNALNNIEVEADYGTWYRIYEQMPESAVEYTIELNIKQMEALPEKVTTNRYEESKQIIDGYEFVYDNQGNIVKDSLGNPVKVPDYKTVTAFITETWQEKVATVSGEVKYIDRNGRVVKTIPVKADGVFQNYYAVATGYFEALTQQSKEKLGGKPLPFPSDSELLVQAIHQLGCTVNDVLDDYNDEYLNQ